jgi:8-oxo-dGTP pyrophosphatase MutT (NUDIX family)
MRYRSFEGAGILFAHRKPDGEWHVLLFRRSIAPDRGKWSVVGGRRNAGESFELTAVREAVEEALYPERRPEALVHRLGRYLSPGFDIEMCRKDVTWLPLVFTYHTFLIELVEQAPTSEFRLNPRECDACEWFPARHLPVDVHHLVPRSVRRLTLL